MFRLYGIVVLLDGDSGQICSSLYLDGNRPRLLFRPEYIDYARANSATVVIRESTYSPRRTGTRA